ncbi:hypothetical protein M0R45_021649 [Rubus argutus]|uniref:Uncharacterized protein n=1 Tax=Rubus argutus TaxID=59490 RepID=A0AAW1XBY5_RUBAR
MGMTITTIFATKALIILANYLAPAPLSLGPMVVSVTLSLEDILNLLVQCDVAAEEEAITKKEEVIAVEAEAIEVQ